MKKIITLYKSDCDTHIKPEMQKDKIKYCRFIIFREAKRIHVYNSYDQRRTPYKNREGLQIGDIFYYVEYGIIKHSFIKKQCASIRKIFRGIPNWADSKLINKYYKFRSRNNKRHITSD